MGEREALREVLRRWVDAEPSSGRSVAVQWVVTVLVLALLLVCLFRWADELGYGQDQHGDDGTGAGVDVKAPDGADVDAGLHGVPASAGQAGGA